MTAPELTLKAVRNTLKKPDSNYGESAIIRKEHVVRVSDLMTDEQKAKIRQYRTEKAQKRQGFDAVDAYSAEILGRFGYEAWKAWQTYEIDSNKMARMVMAERAREKSRLLGLESIIISAVAGANNPTKGGHSPRSLKNAIKILKMEQKAARGEMING